MHSKCYAHYCFCSEQKYVTCNHTTEESASFTLLICLFSPFLVPPCPTSPYSQWPDSSVDMLLKDLPREALLRPLTRNEVLGMLVRLTVFGAATYYSIKWVVEAMDPTSKQKSQSKKRVCRAKVAYITCRSFFFACLPSISLLPSSGFHFSTLQAEQLMKRIGVEGVKLTDYEMNIACHLVDPHTIKVILRQ